MIVTFQSLFHCSLLITCDVCCSRFYTEKIVRTITGGSEESGFSSLSEGLPVPQMITYIPWNYYILTFTYSLIE